MGNKHMIELLLYTVFSLLATGCLAKVLFFSIQEGQWLDKLIGWQAKLKKWDFTGNELLAKAGGLCDFCFAHAIAFFGYWAYFILMKGGFDLWITTGIDNAWVYVPVNIIWYLGYVGIGTITSLYVISKMFK